VAGLPPLPTQAVALALVVAIVAMDAPPALGPGEEEAAERGDMEDVAGSNVAAKESLGLAI